MGEEKPRHYTSKCHVANAGGLVADTRVTVAELVSFAEPTRACGGWMTLQLYRVGKLTSISPVPLLPMTSLHTISSAFSKPSYTSSPQ